VRPRVDGDPLGDDGHTGLLDPRQRRRDGGGGGVDDHYKHSRTLTNRTRPAHSGGVLAPFVCTIDSMSESVLRRELVSLIQREREAAGLSPADLAARAGVPAATLARIERGTLAPSLDTVERLLAALGVRLRLDTEPLTDDLEAQLDRLAWTPVAERLAKSGLAHLLDTLDGFAFAVDGALAANLHGVPLPTDALEIAVAWTDAEALNRWLVKRFAYRWHERSGEFRALDLDPRAPGPHYWQTSFGAVRARMCDALPSTVDIEVGGRTYRVRPLTEVEPADEDAARLLRRFQERLAGAGPTPAGAVVVEVPPAGAVVVEAPPSDAGDDPGQPLAPVATVGN
jgi:transcriptional regulator with XRE-family HTH domain